MPNSALCTGLRAFLYRHYCNRICNLERLFYSSSISELTTVHYVFLTFRHGIKVDTTESQQLNLIKENVVQLFSALRFFLLFTFLVLVPYCRRSQ